MSQATQGAPAPQPAAPPTTAVVGTPAPTPAAPGTGRATAYESLGTSREDDVARRQAAQVPRTLTRLRLGAIVVCLLFGALTGLQLALSWQANRTAAADTEQLIRVQAIKTNLLRADALATNAFLIGGLEPAEQRAAYDGAIDQLVASNSTRTTDAMGAHHPWWVFLPAVVAVVLLWFANRWIGRRFHRRVNPGILIAVLAVGVVGIVAAFLVNDQQNQNDDLTDGSFQAVVDGSSARTSANDAKANESLRLIARGSGQAFEDAWVAAAAIVDQALLEPSLNGLQGSWATYKSQHQEIVDLDDGGDW